MTWLFTIVVFGFVSTVCAIAYIFGKESQALRLVLQDTITHLAARNATDAAEAIAIKNRAELELEMMKDVLRAQKKQLVEDAPLPKESNQVITADGRILHELSLDDI